MTTMAVVIVSYNTREHLRACLASIPPGEADAVLVVDNGSHDGSVEMVQASFPAVELLANDTNPGYGAAANQAISRSTADYVLLLNSDTRLAPGGVQALRAYLDDHPRAAVVGPRLVNPDGSLQPSCYSFPTPYQIFLEESLLGRLAYWLPAVRGRYLRTWPHDRPKVTPVVLGAALALRREAFQDAGGFDRGFFMYFEEIDLCYRLRRAGWETHFTPVTEVVHVGGASTSQRAAEMKYQLFVSTQQFYCRHFDADALVRLQLGMAAIAAARLGRDLVQAWRNQEPRAREERLSMVRVWRRILRDCLSPEGASEQPQANEGMKA